jgi:twitching motility protein PilT
VICQRLAYRPDLKMQVPECEILMSAHSVKSFIRRGDFFKMMSAIETGGDQGMWTYPRYRSWLEMRRTWHTPGERVEEEPASELLQLEETNVAPPPVVKPHAPAAREPASTSGKTKDGLLEIEPEEGGLEAIISKLKTKP